MLEFYEYLYDFGIECCYVSDELEKLRRLEKFNQEIPTKDNYFLITNDKLVHAEFSIFHLKPEDFMVFNKFGTLVKLQIHLSKYLISKFPKFCLRQDHLKDLKYIEYLGLRFLKLENEGNSFFDIFENLKNLKLDKCLISEISLPPRKNQKNIHITNCDVEYISHETFEGIDYIFSLHLSGNKLKEIDFSIFENTKVKALYLSKNSINHLPANISQYLPEIEYLSIAYNPIDYLPYYPLPKLKWLQISSNISLDPKYLALERLDIIEISEIPKFKTNTKKQDPSLHQIDLYKILEKCPNIDL